MPGSVRRTRIPQLTPRRALVAAAVLLPLAALAWWLGSPLFLSTTVEEEFPLSAGAVVPAGMSPAEVEEVMAEMAAQAHPVLEEMPGEARSAVRVKAGRFSDVDSFHRGSGSATIYRLEDGSALLRLEEFQVTNGPDLHVLLVPHPRPAGREDLAGYLSLGKLKGNIGDQNYPIPGGTDLDAFGSVVIYCLPFHVLFSVAPLEEAR